ncbi:MAG: ATP-binding protein [Armatimonadetes bacterium]|nr:ATP-binding protein [Armatimonadota bacterium]
MFKDLLNAWNRKDLVDLTVPRRTFEDVILPESTRRALDQALVQIRKHDLIYTDWGLGERHEEGVGLAFNFAGPPGTGKTICAEAIAHQIGRKLYKVKYSEMESMWAGETSKNIVAVFREAKRLNAVLFFDEADSIASRRFTSMSFGYEREANQSVNVLLAELETFEGVVIFATNLASNFDPAFERRIRTHILFEMPGVEEREKIWKVQLHSRTPLAPDVDFRALAEKYEFSGGDIKNAVLKAAQLAAAEPGSDYSKAITQEHFIQGAEQVIASKKVMEQNLFEGKPQTDPVHNALQTMQVGLSDVDGRLNELAVEFYHLQPTLQAIREELNAVSEQASEEMEKLDQGIQRVHQETQTRTSDLGRDVNTMGTRLYALAIGAGIIGAIALLEDLLEVFMRH